MEKSVIEWLEQRQKERIDINPNESAYWYIKRIINDFEKAKEMEKNIHKKWNNFIQFLESEKTIGISDIKTIERIQWYFSQYYSEPLK